MSLRWLHMQVYEVVFPAACWGLTQAGQMGTPTLVVVRWRGQIGFQRSERCTRIWGWCWGMILRQHILWVCPA